MTRRIFEREFVEEELTTTTPERNSLGKRALSTARNVISVTISLLLQKYHRFRFMSSLTLDISSSTSFELLRPRGGELKVWVASLCLSKPHEEAVASVVVRRYDVSWRGETVMRLGPSE